MSLLPGSKMFATKDRLTFSALHWSLSFLPSLFATMKIRVSESGSPIHPSGTQPTPWPQRLGRFPRYRSPPSPTRTMKHEKPEPVVKAEPIDVPCFAVKAEPVAKKERDVEAEQKIKREQPTVKLEQPAIERVLGLKAKSDIKAKGSSKERADVFVETLRSIRTAATKNVQDLEIVQHLMANFITVTTATKGSDRTGQAKQVEMVCLQVERACHAIVAIGTKIIRGSAPGASALRSGLAQMSELCAGASPRASVVERTLRNVPADELRMGVVQERIQAVQGRLEMVMQKIEGLDASPTAAAAVAREDHTQAELSEMALRTLMQAKIGAGNAIHNLDTIDCFTDDWELGDDSPLTSPALDIHLHCQYAAEECKSIMEILDGFLANPASGQQVGIFTEMEIRRENAVDEVKKLVKVIEELAETQTDPALSLQEMKKRGERLVGKAEGLKVQIDELEKMVQTPVLQQGQSQASAQQQVQ
ncbi:hypothetical protein LTR85_002799 [Meristemomyces frigidus]|nr:hypothetical protein LTR85_002799 [Meristemomyces frigidus]